MENMQGRINLPCVLPIKARFNDRKEVDYMNIDYNKVSFNELDMEYPLQAFFNYEISKNEIDEWLANEVSCEEIPEEISIVGIELCLTIFARHDFKLEAVCTSDGGNQFWVELNNKFTNADEFVSLIPDYGKIKLEDLPGR